MVCCLRMLTGWVVVLGLAVAVAAGGPGYDLRLLARTAVDGVVADHGPQPEKLAGNPDSWGQKSVARAMLLSAVLPGLGQVYAGGTRGYVVGGTMAAVDVFSAWQYFENNGKGDDKKTEYEAWARDHYLRDRFQSYVRDTVAVFSGYASFSSCTGTQPGDYDSAACWTAIHEAFPLSKHDDAVFYEQIDVDDKYVFGWDDWDPYGVSNHEDLWLDWDPFSPLPEGMERTSAHRRKYQDMRRDADDFYGRADRFAWIMVIGRVVSMVDAAILVKLRNRDIASLGSNPRLAFKADFDGRPDFKVMLKMRF